VGVIELVHTVFFGQPLPTTSLAISVVGTIAIFAIGITVFNRLSIHCTEV